MYILAVYAGARYVEAGEVSVVMLTALLAYLGQFSQSTINVFQQVVSWRMLDVQLDRLSDVVEKKQEVGVGQDTYIPQAKILGDVKAVDLAFSYGSERETIFAGINIHIEPGEHVAIVGPSGVGKTTFLKILIGLYQPTSGVVFVDGRPMDEIGRQALRNNLGVVLQDDSLFAGTIAENVSFFSQLDERSWILECLQLAGLACPTVRYHLMPLAIVHWRCPPPTPRSRHLP